MSDNDRYHRLELSGPNQFLSYAGYVNLLGKNVNTIKKNTPFILNDKVFLNK
jgi:hypothetical protein